MADLGSTGRLLIVAGLALVVIGVILALGPRIPILGHLPGDIRISRGAVHVFIPLGTMLVLSLLLSVLLNLVGRGR